MRIFRSLWSWLKGQVVAERPDFRLFACDDEPELLSAGVLYLVGPSPHQWKATLLCPCGCDEQIDLNLMADTKPRWKCTISSAGRVTMHPSVWRTRGCRSHFWIREGNVVWC